MPKTIPTTTLRDNMSDVMKEISKKENYFLITKQGKTISAVVNIDFFEDLLALSSPKYLKSIKQARESYKNGQVFTHEEVFGAL